MKKGMLIFFALLSFCSGGLLAQQALPKDLDKVVSRLNDYMAVRPQEKIHIHFDKPFYSVGDTIWFKAYLVNALGHRLSSISKVVHIDINVPNGKSKHMVLPVNAGMASAQLVLTDSIYTAGDYPLRAYTQWMRNAGEDYFFNHTLHVGDVLHYKANASASFNENMQGLTAELNYTHSNGFALPSLEVTYKLKQGEKVLFTGKLTTDISGKAGVVFPPDKMPIDGTLVLETTSMMKSGPVLNNRFVVNTSKKNLGLNFFPEGGSLTAGIRSKVAFKAVGKDGLGAVGKGYIENDKGEQVSAFETGRFGMGVFALLPQNGNTYTAVLTDGMYKGQRFVLPRALPEGFVLSANRTGTDDLIVRISRTASMETTEVRLVIQANGEVQQAIKLPMNSASVTFTIEKSKLADGINQLTLFSADNRPLAERLVFVQQKQTQTVLESERPEYATRDLIKLHFDNTDSVVGGYSVAVVKADKVTLPEEKQLSIYSNILLSSDLKGHIEDPNYYFTNPDAQKAAELDALLLTQGWRRFSWTEVLTGQAVVPKYKAEEGLELNGKITTLTGGKPVPNAKIKLLAAKEMLFLDTVADAQGRFSFKDLQLGDSVEIILRASGAKESNKVKVVLDELPPTNIKEDTSVALSADTAMKTYLSQTSSLFDEMERTGKIIQGTTLKTVEIVTKKKIPEIKGSVYPFAAAPPDYTFEPDKLQEMVNLETHLRGLLGVQVRQRQIFGLYQGTWGPMVILLNGSPVEDLSGIDPRSLTGVQIIRGSVVAANMATSLMVSSTGYGIVFLTIKGIPNKFIKPNRPPGFLQHSVAGYTYAREFYTPSYEVQKDSPKNDFRSTLFWKPDIITGEDGKAEFSFYASDEPGQYRVTLEGIGANGQLCRKITYFVVK